MADRNLERLTSIDSQRSKKLTATSQGHYPACQPGTTFYAAHSTFSGNLGDRLNYGSDPSPIRSGARVPTQLITDHPHLFEVGGENYHTDFLLGTMCADTRVIPEDKTDLSWQGAPRFLPKPSTLTRRIQKGLATTSRVLTLERRQTIPDPKP